MKRTYRNAFMKLSDYYTIVKIDKDKHCIMATVTTEKGEVCIKAETEGQDVWFSRITGDAIEANKVICIVLDEINPPTVVEP